MRDFIEYEFTSKHPTMDRYNITRGTIQVHEFRGRYSAQHGEFGCGKEYATPEAAIINMLASHSCTVTIHGRKS